MRPLCLEKTLPHKLQINDCIFEGGKFAIECPLEIDSSEAPIMCPIARYSAYPERTWMLA